MIILEILGGLLIAGILAIGLVKALDWVFEIKKEDLDDKG
jgi:hypothetical protein